jgi:hypothetical protein
MSSTYKQTVEACTILVARPSGDKILEAVMNINDKHGKGITLIAAKELIEELWPARETHIIYHDRGNK